MARKTKQEKLGDIHQEALLRFNPIISQQRSERQQCVEDRRFATIPGAQWEGPLGEQFENKPKFEVNKVHQSVLRIENEYRNNRITVTFVPTDGSKSDKLSDTCAGLYRADEQDSCAEEAYDNAFQEGANGGMGAWRLRPCYEDEYSDDEAQRIRIEMIAEADSCVFFDLGAKRQDKSDAKYCFVLTPMTFSDYEDTYDDDLASWPQVTDTSMFEWKAENIVWVAEYYKVVEKKEKTFTYEGLDGTEQEYTKEDFEEDEGLEENLEATGFKLVNTRVVKSRSVHKYILSGNGILEDNGPIAGPNIPIVPVYGKRWYIDNVERCMGHVRLAKDSQRLKNMQVSKLGELAASSSVEKPIFTPAQIKGYENLWRDDNVENYAFMLVNPINDLNGNPVTIGPQAYTKAPSIPPAMAALMEVTEQDLKDILGIAQQGEQMQANMSGVAIELTQNRLDMQTFIYVDNMKKAMRRSGEIWLGMAKELYIEEGRKMKAVDAQDEVGSVEIMKPTINQDTAEIEYESDISKSRFGVVANVGPSSLSRRNATVRSLKEMAATTTDPDTQQVLSAMIMLNLEGEGIEQVRDYFRQKLLRMGVIKPNAEEQKQLEDEQANKKPDPQAEFMQASAQEAATKAEKNKADTAKVLAETEKTKVETAEIAASVSREDQRHLVELVNGLGETTQAQSSMVPVQP
jgi:hypothetical protein